MCAEAAKSEPADMIPATETLEAKCPARSLGQKTYPHPQINVVEANPKDVPMSSLDSMPAPTVAVEVTFPAWHLFLLVSKRVHDCPLLCIQG